MLLERQDADVAAAHRDQGDEPDDRSEPDGDQSRTKDCAHRGTSWLWDEGGASGLLQVGPDLLIPFARSICVSIDVTGKRIEVDLPEGLKDLNRS